MDIEKLDVAGSLAANKASSPLLPTKSSAPLEALVAVDTKALPPVDHVSLEQAREAVITKAANTVANYFAVSDTRFTIFRDSAGQYITRFTNLKDGSVSYYPEPKLLKTYREITGEDLSLVSTRV